MGRELDELPIALNLLDTIKRGSAPLGNVKKALGRTYRRSVRRIGGYYYGTAEWHGEDYEKLEMFQDGMMRQLVESLGGLTTWRGFVAGMVLTLDGQKFERRWDGRANRVKAIYSRIGDNQFTNGGAESGAWTAYNTPTTLEVSTAWYTEGAQSCHIVADSANDGATIQTGITIVAAKAYDCRLSVRLVSGTWKLEIYRTDTGATLASVSENTAGDHTINCSISDTNTYAGAIGVRFYCTDAAGEIYADAGVFQEAPARAETAWSEDADAQDEYGVMEEVLLLAGQSDEDANDKAVTYRKENAWTRARPPSEFDEEMPASGDDEDGSGVKLEVEFYGDAYTVRNKYSTRTGTDTRSNHVTNLVGDCEFVSAGTIEENLREYFIDTQAPIRIWEILKDIALAGDLNGALWQCGVFGDRLFDYKPVETAILYHARGGKLYHTGGGLVEPWLAVPGYCYVDDLPIGPADLTGDDGDDPHVLFLEEVEFDAARWLDGESGLKYRVEAK